MIRIEAIPALAAKLAAKLKSSGGKHSTRLAKKIRVKWILTLARSTTARRHGLRAQPHVFCLTERKTKCSRESLFSCSARQPLL
jgi:hypothetical protein